MAEELHRWAPDLADDLDRVRKGLPELLHPEAQHLAAVTRRLAPHRSGALRRATLARGLQVLSLVYAEIQSSGGVIRAQRHGWLTIPVRPGYQPTGGRVTVRGRDGHQYVVRSGTLELWAVRRRQVRIKGTRFLERALQQHLATADERIGQRLVDEVT